MDTDDLTEMAHECLRIAESVCHYLTLEFGVMSNNFSNENDYLNGILKRIKKIKRHPFEFIEYWGLEEELSRKSLTLCLKNLESHIEKTLGTPIQDRAPISFD
jgi:hypothetical protein